MPMLSFLPPRLPHRLFAAEPTTAELLSQLAAGESKALEPLYRRESAAVYRYALALCGNPAWAADAMHDAFLALAQRPAAVDPALGTLGAWLAGVARHSLAARWRLGQREHALDADDDEPDGGLAAADADPATLMVQAQTAADVWAALRRLPLVFAEAVVLVDLQERPYAEAAAIAGVPVNTLRTRLHRGRQRLAALLRPAEPVAPTAPARHAP